MIDLGWAPEGRRMLVERADELPMLAGARRLYLDAETTSFDPREAALLPYHGHRIAGVAVTADDERTAWYVPLRHHTSPRRCVDLDAASRWLRSLLRGPGAWVNHNVKFDAHFCHVEGATFSRELHDTLVLAKLIDSDRGYGGPGYALDELARDWLDAATPEIDELGAWLRAAKTRDYGDAPPDLLGRYACRDVLLNRELDAYMLRRRPAEVAGVWDTEIKLTPVLWDMEVEGLRVRPDELAVRELFTLHRVVQLEEQMHELAGRVFSPGSHSDREDVILNVFGLPAVDFTDTSRARAEEEDDDSLLSPSFSKDALKAYQRLPDVVIDEKKSAFFAALAEWQKLSTLMSLFIRPYQALNVDGVLHSQYNQSVRTGRVSSKQPNAQQLSPEAKALVHPPDDECFLRFDYSQVEFRIIVHYIQDERAIRAYVEDPETDFHQFVADLCGIPRKPAKNVNFAVSYGGGKNKVTAMLASEPTLVGDLMQVARGDAREFARLCRERAEKVYETYHETFPGVRRCARRAEALAVGRGWVKNAYGRMRHLQERFAYRAFNSVIQSCAADVMKERLVAVSPRYNSEVRALGLRVVASVHDEFLFTGSRETTRDARARQTIRDILENTSFKFRVPIVVEGGWSDKSWKEASSDEAVFVLPRERSSS